MIGLEIHCQLTKLNSKLFCWCKADYRGMEPNTNVCPICMGLPGTLPLLNKDAVKSAMAIALSLNCILSERLAFFRKNYFYPDLPKNFQITQFDVYGPTSIGSGGQMDVDGKTIRITRLQLEEDPGRLTYDGNDRRTTLVDYNRAGTPLVEIVTEPDFESPRQARNFMSMLADVVENLNVANPHLDGAMRADGNVSVHGGNKVEIKNINSFHDLEKALHFETTRQNSLHDRGIVVKQETRHWDEGRRITISSRTKETEMDYRYFLEADIPWVGLVTDAISRIKENLPESAMARQKRYVSEYGIQPQVAAVLASDKFCCDLFEESHTAQTAKIVANMITTDFMGVMNTRDKRVASHITPDHIRTLATAIHEGKVTRAISKDLLYKAATEGGTITVTQNNDGMDLESVVQEALGGEREAVLEARRNPQVINYLVGKVMKQTRGQADPKRLVEYVRRFVEQYRE